MWPLSRKTPAEKIAEAIEANNFGIANEILKRELNHDSHERHARSIKQVTTAFLSALDDPNPQRAIVIMDMMGFAPLVLRQIKLTTAEYTLHLNGDTHKEYIHNSLIVLSDNDILGPVVRSSLAHMCRVTPTTENTRPCTADTLAFMLDPDNRSFYNAHITADLLKTVGALKGREISEASSYPNSPEFQMRATIALNSVHRIGRLLSLEQDEPLFMVFNNAVRAEGACVSFSAQRPLAILDRKMPPETEGYPVNQPLSVFCADRGYHRTPEGYAVEVTLSRRADLLSVLKSAAIFGELESHTGAHPYRDARIIFNVLEARYPESNGYQLRLPPAKYRAPQQA